ncbi:DUF1120 domain-containing protein [Pseudomonas yamanorum]|uniref:DUF1120 domain-containing protein n=1 Tax=Pseudomonas yamanorum TaxID=515393 RepID=A0A7Y8K977_9PSED|nr:DUF1120 domain-containing protein [Pseudomonas yamanorum]NVZ83794.1 DUF1120 domain-containing protein [Pseudomonas yamanorum]NWE17417.1 DUF1120 domain-containing protein [Pseudomonas yamanorum]NWE37902.1 DUF1120 domain-containing protein [Pseudomonas yamanorum]NWE80139.1 DUF1120 domain-containing protein [Pseudomonas yamanorum]
MNSSTVVFLATLLLAPTALAISKTELTVQGIITPSACDPVVSSGGVVDYGKMTAKELNPEQPTSLPPQFLRLSIQCEGPTMLALDTIDNRAGSSINQYRHGLGMTPSNEKLGSVSFHLRNPVADGAPVRTLNSTDGGASWVPSSMLSFFTLTAIAAAGTSTTPIAITRFDADMQLYTAIDGTDRLTVLDEIPMDGHATLQMKYL